jgi:hypothetical protein
VPNAARRARLLHLLGRTIAPQVEALHNERLEVCLLHVGQALTAIDSLDLTENEALALKEETNLDVWEALAPVTADLIKRLLETLRDFDALGDPGASELCRLLRARVLELGRMLHHPGTVANAWVLLDELFRFKTECGEGLEAMIAAVLSSVLPALDLGDLPREALRKHHTKRASQHLQALRSALARPPESTYRQVLTLTREFHRSAAFKALPPSRRAPTLRFLQMAERWPEAYSAEIGAMLEDFGRVMDLQHQWNEQALAELSRTSLGPS